MVAQCVSTVLRDMKVILVEGKDTAVVYLNAVIKTHHRPIQDLACFVE